MHGSTVQLSSECEAHMCVHVCVRACFVLLCCVAVLSFPDSVLFEQSTFVLNQSLTPQSYVDSYDWQKRKHLGCIC